MKPQLADKHDRDLISDALDETLIVEAAAGSWVRSQNASTSRSTASTTACPRASRPLHNAYK